MLELPVTVCCALCQEASEKKSMGRLPASNLLNSPWMVDTLETLGDHVDMVLQAFRIRNSLKGCRPRAHQTQAKPWRAMANSRV